MVDVGRAPGIRPRPSLWRRLDGLARRAFPVTSTVLLMLLSNAPFGIPDQATLLPAVAVISVFFWSLFRPSGMPPLAVFLIGLLLDLLGWLPLGIGVVTLLTVHAFCLHWRRGLARPGVPDDLARLRRLRVRRGGDHVGAGRPARAAAAPVGPALFQAVLTTALYPALAIPFAHAHRDVAAPERA